MLYVKHILQNDSAVLFLNKLPDSCVSLLSRNSQDLNANISGGLV